MPIASGGFALNAVLEGREPSRAGKPPGGQPPRRATRVASRQRDRGGENVGKLRYRRDGLVVIHSRAQENASPENAMKTGDARHRAPIRSVGADGDHTAAPGIRPGRAVAAGRAPEHRVGSDERDAGANARPRRMDHRLLDSRHVAEDGAVAHARGDGPEQLDDLGDRRGQDDDFALLQIGTGSRRQKVEETVSLRRRARGAARLDADQNFSGKAEPDRFGERSANQADPDDADRIPAPPTLSPVSPDVRFRTAHSRPTARAIAPTSRIVSASIGGVSDCGPSESARSGWG